MLWDYSVVQGRDLGASSFFFFIKSDPDIVVDSFDGDPLVDYPLDQGTYYTHGLETQRLSRLPGGSYEIRSRSGERRIFDGAKPTWRARQRPTEGKLLKTTDRNGNETKLSYDNSGRLAKIEDSFGRFLIYSYTGDLVATAADMAGRTVNYSYSPSGDLIKVLGPGGRTWKYDYDTDHRLVQATDPNGNSTKYQYDSSGRVVAVTAPDGGIWKYDYRVDRLVTSETNPLGRTTVFSLNDDGLVEKITDAFGNSRLFGHDQHFNITSEVSPDGTGSFTSFSTHNDAVLTATPTGFNTNISYNTFGAPADAQASDGSRLLRTYDEQGNRTSLSDSSGRLRQYEYNSRGLLTKVRGFSGGTVEIGYDQKGDPISIQDPRGNITSLVVDDLGRLVKIADPLGNAVIRKFSSEGTLLAETDGEGFTTTYEYDAVGNRVSVADAKGRKTMFQYAPVGFSYRLISTTLPSGRKSKKEHDALGNLTAVVLPGGARYSYAYDAESRLTSATYPTGERVTYAYDAKGRMTEARYGSGLAFFFEYDAADKLVRKTSSTGEVISFSYDAVGRPIRVSANGIETSLQYNVLNQLASETVQIEGLQAMTMSYEYDAEGNVTSIGDGFGKKVTRSYDAMNELVGVTDPDLGAVTLDYDSAGRVASIKHPNGVTSNRQYDRRGLLLKESLKSFLGLTVSDRQYSYDQVGNRTETRDLLAGTTYAYDLDDQLLTSTVKYKDPLLAALRNHSFAYTYDAAGNRTRFEATGEGPLNMSLTPGFRDPLDGLPELRWPLAVDYTYNSATQITKEIARVPSGSTVYQADYAHDEKGSLSTKTVQSSLLAGGTGQTKYAYAQMTGGLSRVDFPGGKSNVFLALGNKVYRHTDAAGRTKHFLYSGDDLMYELDSTGRPIRRYLHGVGVDALLGMVLYLPTPLTDEEQEPGSEDWGDWDALLKRKIYNHQDQTNSVYMLTNTFGLPVGAYRYEPFGRITDGFFVGLRKNTLTYDGRPYLRDLGLFDFRARLLDPRLGRFLQRDPLASSCKGDARDLDYAFVKNNPLNMIDPMGTSALPTYARHCGVEKGDPSPVKEAMLKGWTWTPEYKQGVANECIDCLDCMCKEHDYCLYQTWSNLSTAAMECDAKACGKLHECTIRGVPKQAGPFVTAFTGICAVQWAILPVRVYVSLVADISHGISKIKGWFS